MAENLPLILTDRTGVPSQPNSFPRRHVSMKSGHRPGAALSTSKLDAKAPAAMNAAQSYGGGSGISVQESALPDTRHAQCRRLGNDKKRPTFVVRSKYRFLGLGMTFELFFLNYLYSSPSALEVTLIAPPTST